MKKYILMSLATLTVLSQSCSKADSGKELRQANDALLRENNDLRQGNEALRTKVAALDQQLAQSTIRANELQRANQAASQRTSVDQVVAQEEAKKRLEADTRLRMDQDKQHTVAAVGKIAAQLDRLLEEIPSVENSSLIAWDISMPKLATCSKDASLQLNLLVAELDGLKFERSEDIKSKIAGFTNGYRSLPGIGRLVVSSRERAAALRAAADPAKSDSDPGAGDESTMNAQLAVFNTMVAECKRLQAEASKLAN